MKISVTGAAGFIGMNLVEELILEGHTVVGIDNLNPSYGTNMPSLRQQHLLETYGFKINHLDICDILSGQKNLEYLNSDVVIHLAGYPGVRQSMTHPDYYNHANVVGFVNLLDSLQIVKPNLFLFASSSSVYGGLESNLPFKEAEAIGTNINNYYAMTKFTNELLGKVHSEITGIPTYGLRFFSVLGKFGRPDMAYWNFTKSILEGQPINLFGDDGGRRGFIGVKDVVKLITRLIQADYHENRYTVLNVGASKSTSALELIDIIKSELQLEPSFINVLARSPYELPRTSADMTALMEIIGEVKLESLESVIQEFTNWYRLYAKMVKN